jgi:5-methylcytosine-specific restriction endonuclease McrA
LTVCVHCKQIRPSESFQQYKEHPNGWCRNCKTQLERERRLKKGILVKRLSVIRDDMKSCMACNEFKPLDQFSPSKRGTGGVGAYCKFCFRVRYKSSPDMGRKYAYHYRARHRERFLALHRIHQFNRKNLINVTCDDTVTDEFLIDLYSTEFCRYCQTYTDPKLRTADHMLPLSRGGWHTASNLIMACNPCNSSKGNKTFDEFVLWRKNDNFC